MTSLWHPGQLLYAGFEGFEVPRDLAALIEQGRVGGVVLFARNVRDPAQLRTLTGSLHASAPEGAPLVVAMDQEGGRVQRLRDPWTRWSPMRRLGEMADPALTAEVARAIARELREVGVLLDFAPSVDVDSNPDNPVIGDRSFSRDPEEVAAQATTFIAAMQAEGVACCAKHFPGHGDTAVDSHVALPRLNHDLARLRSTELVPFRAVAEAGVASMMTSHILFPRLDPKRPATMSVAVMELLRHELAYDGLVFTDDLDMRAVANHFGPAETTRSSLSAGVDVMLACRRTDARDEVLRTLERAPDSLVEKALGRAVAFKGAFARPWADGDATGPPYPEHLSLAARLSSGTIRG